MKLKTFALLKMNPSTIKRRVSGGVAGEGWSC